MPSVRFPGAIAFIDLLIGQDETVESLPDADEVAIGGWDEELQRDGRVVFQVRRGRLRRLLVTDLLLFVAGGVLLCLTGSPWSGGFPVVLGLIGGVVFSRQLRVIDPLVVTELVVTRRLWSGPPKSFPWSAIVEASARGGAGPRVSLWIATEFLATQIEHREGWYADWTRRWYAKRRAVRTLVALWIDADPLVLARWPDSRGRLPGQVPPSGLPHRE